MTTQGVPASGGRAVEAALRHLGARRYDDLVELIEHAIIRPEGDAGPILTPLTEPTSVLSDWTAAERAYAVWMVIEEGVLHPHVTALPRRRRALQAAFRLPDKDIEERWGASLTDRFRQLRALPVFGNATSTQPMEIAWKHGVERLADHLHDRFRELRTMEEWARYKPLRLDGPGHINGKAIFRPPSEGAQKLVVNLLIMTVLMKGRGEYRRISERLIASRDDEGLKYFRAYAFSSESHHLHGRDYAGMRALWGCRAEHVCERGMPVTRLWFPRPLKTGEQAHFIAEAVHEHPKDDERGWANVDVDHYGIDPGALHNGLPVSGLTIRIRFESDHLPTSVWWYAEQNEWERYVAPPIGSPQRLQVVSGEVVKTFYQPCQPRECYGIAYTWAQE